MRFSTFFILAFLALAAAVSGLDCYSAWAPKTSMRMADHWQSHMSADQMRIVRDSAWGDRYAPQSPPRQNMYYSFPRPGMNDDVNTDGPMDFDWPRFAMALVLLTGGTLVCRRIFRSAGGPPRPMQMRQCRQPRRTAQPPPAQALSRMCPRADCSRMNPPTAKFCRRCGTVLSDA